MVLVVWSSWGESCLLTNLCVYGWEYSVSPSEALEPIRDTVEQS